MGLSSGVSSNAALATAAWILGRSMQISAFDLHVLCVRVSSGVYTHTCRCTMCMYVCMHACVYVCMYVYGFSCRKMSLLPVGLKTKNTFET